MNDTLGANSSTKPLKRVAMRRPGAILTADHEQWHYATPIDGDRLNDQYAAFAALVESSGAEVVWLDEQASTPTDDLADSIFTYDPSLIVEGQAIILRPGKPLRVEEAELHRSFYERNGIPILGQIDAPGAVEGGDMFWLDEQTLAVGRGFRTNQSGIDQLIELVTPLGVQVEVYDLPYFHGPDACLHLMSLVSPLAEDLALVHTPLIPTALYERMQELGYTLLHAPEAEFAKSLGLNLNVLATAPRNVIAIDGFPGTVELMVTAGCTVQTFEADALCIPCEGGPTCMTRPLIRE